MTTSHPATEAEPDGTDRAGSSGTASDGNAALEPSRWLARLRRYGYTAPARQGVARRLVQPFPTPSTWLPIRLGCPPGLANWLVRWSGWLGPALVALVAGLLRFRALGSPNAVIFDETYYAKDAWSLYQLGYEGSWPDKADKTILEGASPPLSEAASYVVHPPVGKWIIGLGEWIFGLDPFGWRFMSALLGTLSVFLLCRIGRRLLRSTLLGCLAGGLMAVDGLHFVMSRVALLDLVVMFWILAAFGCLLVDRDRARGRLAAVLPTAPAEEAGTGTDAEAEVEAEARPDVTLSERYGMGLRPWRIAAGLCLGLACATKWNGLYVLAAFGVLTVLWDVGARRTAGAGRPFRAMLRKDALPAFASLVPVALLTYLVSWTGWFATRDGHLRQWAENDGAETNWGWVPGPLRSLWHYQTEVYDFHVTLTSGHTYDSNPWSWLVLGRPVSYFYESPKAGEDGCTAAEGCAREVLALGTPLLWWAACFALAYALYRWLLRRDWRAGAILCGVAAGYLPWFMYQERTIFYFYAVVFLPFLCLAVAMLVGALAGPPGVTERRRLFGVVGSGVLVLLIIWNFIYFWPLYTGEPIPMEDWRARMWFDTWV